MSTLARRLLMGSRRLVLIDRTAGTNIGNFTTNGGLAAAFDGTTSQNSSACAAREAQNGFVGKTLASAKVFGEAVIFGSSDQGFVNDANPSVTITILGKNGTAPANLNNGTEIGTITFTDTSDESAGRTIESTDLTTTWDHIFARVSNVVGDPLHVAELELWEWG